MIRCGTGYDVHRLVLDRPLVLGGVKIPYEKGSLGHSDGDALCHAIADALLGACALGDIGQHFPDTDKRFAGYLSLNFLEQIRTLLEENGWQINNVDATVVLQAPKIASHIPKMRKNIAEVLHCDLDRISVKATTTEGVGITGRGEAVAAQAICSVIPLNP